MPLNSVHRIIVETLDAEKELRGVIVDSRGEKLSIGDIVLYNGINSSEWNIGNVYLARDKSYLVCGFDKKCYLDTRRIRNVLKVTDLYKKYASDYVNYYTTLYEDRLKNQLAYMSCYTHVFNCKEVIWKDAHNQTNCLHMPMFDYFDRKYKAGDLGITCAKGSRTFMYGIVVSDTKMLLENNELIRVKHFMLLDKLNEEEQQIKERLVRNYAERSTQLLSAKERGVQVGEVYTKSSDAKLRYINLGRIHLKVTCNKPCSVWCNLDYTTTDNIWLVMQSNNQDINKYEVFEKLFGESLCKSIHTKDCIYTANKDLCFDYTEVVGFDCLVAMGFDKLKPWGRLNLKKEYCFNAGNKHSFLVSSLVNHSIKIELLDL